MDVGATLRDRREQHKLSLNQLGHITKISVAILRAIENNEIEKLPGGIFTRGFLRAYAREVGLDAEETVTRYLAQFEAPSNDRDVAMAVIEDARPSTSPLAHGETPFDAAAKQSARMPLLLASLALVVGVVGYVTFSASRTSTQSSGLPPDVSPSEGRESLSPSTVPPARPETATSGSHDVALAARGQDVVRLDIRTQSPCWVAATADGVSVAYRLMQAGEREVIEARDEVVLRVGDPAAFTFHINEMLGRPLGRAGQPITVRITAQNYHEFIGP
jgi:cytoskeleton protein RodZ